MLVKLGETEIKLLELEDKRFSKINSSILTSKLQDKGFRFHF